MNNEVKKFYKYLSRNTLLQKKLQEGLKNIHTEQDFKNFIKLEIIPLAKELNYKFTQEDLINYEKESLQHLTNEDLLNIAGGISPKSIILSGGLFSLALLGSGALSGTAAHATVPTNVVKKSFDNHLKNSEFSSNSPEVIIKQQIAPLQDQQSLTENIAEPSQNQESASTENPTNFSHNQEPTPAGHSIDSLQNQELMFTEHTANFLHSQEDTSTEHPIDSFYNQEPTPTGHPTDFSQNQESTSTEQYTNNLQSQQNVTEQMSKKAIMESSKVFANNYIQKAETNNQIDMTYIANALNLLDPYIYNLTKTTEFFRFFDGNKQQITLGKQLGDEIPSWEFSKDEGEGSPNFMRCLFPSSSGELNSEGGNPQLPSFSRDCKPSPEMIANIAGYIYNYVRREDKQIVENAKKELDYTIDILKNFNNNENKIEDIKKFFNNYLKDNLNDININIDSVKSLQTYLYLLKNATYMIQEQEFGNEQEIKYKILPKYTTEKMLMCYFICHFNNENDVNRFYNRAKKIIFTNNNGNGFNFENSLKRLEKINKILDKISSTDIVPYTEPLVANGCTQVITTKDNKLKFTSELFADCADTVVRHIINLLSYNDENQWFFILDNLSENDKNRLKHEIDNICNAIKNNSEIEKQPLARRIIQFFYYQKMRGGADLASQEARSFWNYVVNNMDSETYKINYVHENNELDTGWINCLKSTYNILHALKSCNPNFKTKLEDAKNKIDYLEKNLINKVSIDTLKNNLQEAIKATFGIITNVIVDKPQDITISDKTNDIFSLINISKCDKNNKILFTFPILQTSFHATVEYSPRSIQSFNENEKELISFMQQDHIAQLLTYTFNISSQTIYDFNYCFGQQMEKIDYINTSSFWSNYTALTFLKEAQGEGNNSVRILNLLKHYAVNIADYSEISVKYKRNKKSLSQFILDKYIKTKDHIVCFLDLDNNLENDCYEGLDKYVNKYNNLKLIHDNNNIAICKILPNKTVYILYLRNQPDLIIPKTISIDSTSYNISKVLGTISKDVINVTFQNGYKELFIEPKSFNTCELLKQFTIPNSITSLCIGQKAFENCSSLSDFILSTKLKSLAIERKAFRCTGLSTFAIPNSVTSLSIGQNAFESCSSLSTFIIPIHLKSLTIENETFNNCTELSSFTIPDSVTSLSIGQSAFKSCSSLSTFMILANLKSLTIENETFTKCTKLSNFTISSSVTSLKICPKAFFECYSLTDFNISDSITSLVISNNSFFNCELLSTFKVPNNTTSLFIDNYAFALCHNLSNFSISNNVISLTIGNYAFAECSKLSNFYIPDTVTHLTIGNHAFQKCLSLHTFYVSNSLTYLTIEEGTFYLCNTLSKFNIPNNITKLSIGNSAFSHCSELTDFNIPNNLTNLFINNFAFCECPKLANFNISNNSKLETLTILRYAFSQCPSLNRFFIPVYVKNKNIDSKAFDMNTNIV